MSINRIYHPWTAWECYKSGFYSTSNIDEATAKDIYKTFLGDLYAFNAGMDRVFKEWPVSCEHFLSNCSMNRIAWLGQASACIVLGIPSRYKGGFKLLTPEQQQAANALADRRLKEWLSQRCKAA